MVPGLFREERGSDTIEKLVGIVVIVLLLVPIFRSFAAGVGESFNKTSDRVKSITDTALTEAGVGDGDVDDDTDW
mgnify:CR=1 FL=1